MLDVTDEAVLGADPEDVFTALLDAYTGRSNWPEPDISGTPLSAKPEGQIGELIDIRVRGSANVRFTARLAEISRPSTLRIEYVDGDFLGEGRWTIEARDVGTRARFRWQVRPGPWHLRILSKFLDFGKAHSEIMSIVFQHLDRHLRALRPEAGSSADE